MSNEFSMTSRNKRGLLLAAGFGALILSAPALAAPDLIVFNGDIYTVDSGLPRVEAFAVEDGKFTAIGTNEQVRGLAGAETKLIDAKGQTVTPGFIDAHQHFNGTSNQLNLYVKTHAEWAELIRAEHQRLPKGAWLKGGSWDHTIIDDVLPTKEFLDEIVGDRPVILTHIDGHFVWVNSAALKLAGIKADTPVPPGGEIVVDPRTGEPTGILKEGASQLVRRIVPVPTQQERFSQLPAALRWANSLGITGMHNMSSYDDFLHVLENGDLTVRIWHGARPDRDLAKGPDAAVSEILALRQDIQKRVQASGKEQENGPLFDLGFVKLINDGVLSIHTAVLLEDYEDKPGWKGEWITNPALLAETVDKLNRAGLQVAIHSIGDAGVRASLDAFEAASAKYSLSLPNRIEHVEMLNPKDLPRFAKYNVVASMTPNHMTKAVAYIEERIDPERENEAYTWRSLKNAGATVIFGSDASTSIHQDPLKQIGDAIYRTNHAGFNDGKPWHGEQAVTFAEALRAYTLGPAQTTRWGDVIGSISVGKWADFVLIDGKVAEPGDRSLYDLAVEATYLAGREVYRKSTK